MPLKQQSLPFSERKKSSTSVFKAKGENGVNSRPHRQTLGSSTVQVHNDDSAANLHDEEPTQPRTPSKRRTRNHSDPPSPPKVKCEGESTCSTTLSTTSSKGPTAPATPSSKVLTAPTTPLCKAPTAPATPSNSVAPSPKTPSTYLSQLSLKSPAVSVNNERIPPNSLFKEPEDLLAKARNALHTHTVTDLPGREEELSQLKQFINDHLDEGTSGSLYISGPPGTGKTACLSHVMEQPDLKQRCRIVNINCTAVGSPNIIYSKLVDQLKLRKSGTAPLEVITKYLQRRHKTLLVVFDEMDQLGTRNQSVLYTVFEWPATYPKGIILIGIANALDLTDRMLPRLKAKLKLAPQLLHFAPYSREQLLSIFNYRLKKSGAADAFNPLALQLLASKQAAVNGDARRALDTARRLVENEGCKLFLEEGKSSELNPQQPIELVMQQIPSSDATSNSPCKPLRTSPRKPMTPVHAPSQASGQSIKTSNIHTESPGELLRSPSRESNLSLKENASPVKVKSARKLNFLGIQDTESVGTQTNSDFSHPIAGPKPIDVKSVMAVYGDVYGNSQTLGRSGEELPFQHKLAICSLLLILRKGKNKDVTLGKHHDVYRKICTKRRITPLDQGAFLSMLELIEARGILHLQSRGKGGAGRLLRVCLQWVEEEVISALKDRDLLASISSDVSCLS